MSEALQLAPGRAPTRPRSLRAPARADLDVRGTSGFLVADRRGRLVGSVEGPMYGTSEATPDALSVRFSVLRWRRRLVPTGSIESIDVRARVIGLSVDRAAIKDFL